MADSIFDLLQQQGGGAQQGGSNPYGASPQQIIAQSLSSPQQASFAGRSPVSANTLTQGGSGYSAPPSNPQQGAPAQQSLYQSLLQQLLGQGSQYGGQGSLSGMLGQMLNNPTLANQQGGFQSQNYTPNMPQVYRVDYRANDRPGGLLNNNMNWGPNGLFSETPYGTGNPTFGDPNSGAGKI